MDGTRIHWARFPRRGSEPAAHRTRGVHRMRLQRCRSGRVRARRIGFPQLYVSADNVVAQCISSLQHAGLGVRRMPAAAGDASSRWISRWRCSAGATYAASTCRTAGCAKPAWWRPICARRCCAVRTCGAPGRRTPGSTRPTCAARASTRRCGPPPRCAARRIDIEQALAFAAAHGLDVHGELNSAALEPDLPPHQAQVAEQIAPEHAHVEPPRAGGVLPMRVLRSQWAWYEPDQVDRRRRCRRIPTAPA